MELIVISDTRLKVMLTLADMELYGLNFESEDYDSTQARRAIWHLFDEVKRRCGFDAAGDRVLVQVWPAGDGGCELFVTKMSLSTPAEKTPVPQEARYVRYLYRFDRLIEMLSVCRVLEHDSYSQRSEVWTGDDGKWYLILEGKNLEKETVDTLSFVEEYGTRMLAPFAMQMLSEHAQPLVIGDAVGKMAALA